jgi:hypothetical protein
MIIVIAHKRRLDTIGNARAKQAKIKKTIKPAITLLFFNLFIKIPP